VLRIENDGEFCGKEFDQFCKQCGIAHHIPYKKMEFPSE
jgi:hypothetical protein